MNRHHLTLLIFYIFFSLTAQRKSVVVIEYVRLYIQLPGIHFMGGYVQQK